MIDENKLFREVASRICGNLDIGQALWQSLICLKEYVPVDWMTMGIYEPDIGAIRYIATSTVKKGKNIDILVHMPPKARISLDTKNYPDVMIVNDPKDDPVCSAVSSFYKQWNSSLLLMSLIIGNNKLGTLALRTEGKGHYHEDHARLLSSLNILFAIAMSNAMRYQELVKLKESLADDNQFLSSELHHLSGDEVVGTDHGLKEVMNMVSQVAASDSPVLLLGETGVGKEVIANAIHEMSPRRNGPFIKVNCGAIPETLYDSELFGHEKGAFTGAITRKRGRFERAHDGTIFLDEIGDLPLPAQVRLLRVIQNREIERVGGTQFIPLNVRIITATHHNLEHMVAKEQFREDLWYRINIFPIMIPPLRQRKDDIPALVNHFIKQKSKALNLRTIPTLTPGAMASLMECPWKGNVRELENTIERALIQHRGGPLLFDNVLNIASRSLHSNVALEGDNIHSIDSLLATYIRQVLTMTGGRINGPHGAAKLLNIHPNTLRNKMDRLGISYKRRKQASSSQ